MIFDPYSTNDPVTTDPVLTDLDYPASATTTHFMSQGSPVHAFLYLAAGPAPKSTVILSPQAFGGDNMDSLIHPIRNAGMNVLTYHPRGMWDDRSEYSLLSAIDDMHAAADFLRTADDVGKRTSAGKGYRVDADMIGAMGPSGGGGTVSYAAAAENENIKFVMGFAPANHELHRDLSILDPAHKEMFDFVKAETAGRVDVERRARGMRADEIDRLSIIHQAPRLVDKKMLLVGGLRDTDAPVRSFHIPIANALRAAGASSLTDVVLDTDHEFTNTRIALARLVIAWLRHEQIL